MLYKIQNLTKRYNDRIVLDLKELSLERGRVLGLIGPNGAGKTTLLEILAFLLEPTAGSVWFGNEMVDFGGMSLKHLRQDVVLVQQHPILFSTTVVNNVVFPLKIRGVSKEAQHRIMDELLALVGMESFKDAKAHTLSGGETQRVAIAQALACSPEVILLDEPTASVDMENQITIEHIIKEINLEKGISVILTTHDMIQASRLADEIVFMFEGKAAGSIYENIFSAHIEEDASDRKFCVIRDGFRLGVNCERSGPVRITINPEKVDIQKDEMVPATENSFKGKLIQLTDEHSRIRALVDVGVPLGVLISKEHFGGLQLSIGSEVWIVVPPDSIEIF